jgi:hypothetical protein
MYFKLLQIPGVTPESPLLTPQGVQGQLGDGCLETAYSPVFDIVNFTWPISVSDFASFKISKTKYGVHSRSI